MDGWIDPCMDGWMEVNIVSRIANNPQIKSDENMKKAQGSSLRDSMLRQRKCQK